MLEWITETMDSMGYIAIVFLMFLENVFPPIPSELIMPLAGYLVSQGKLTFGGVVAAGTFGTVLGALPLYYAGKLLGLERLKMWADRYGRWFAVSAGDLDNTNQWFNKYGIRTIFLCRLVPGIRSLISIPAGINNMNMGVFLVYTTIGSSIWSALLALAGYILGENYDQVETYIGPASYIVIGVLCIAYIVWTFWYKPRRDGST